MAILTAIGTAHLGNFKDREQLAREKIRIFDKLWGDHVFGVVSREMDYLELARKCSRVPLVEVSLKDETAAFYGIVEDVLSGQMTIVESTTGERTQLVIGRPGVHICSDALLAFAAARTVGVSAKQCQEGLKTLFVPGARWKRSVVGGVTYIDDTFNASPASMKAVLSLVKEMPGRVIVVLGDMLELGHGEVECHREIGALAADITLGGLVAFGPLSSTVLADAYDERMHCQKAIRAHSLQEVCNAIRQLVSPGGTVVFKASNAMRLGEAIPGVRE